MKTTLRQVPVWELPPRLRQGRSDADFVDLVIEDAPAPSDADKLAYLRNGIEEADADVRAERLHEPDEVFSELRAELASKAAR